MLASTNTVIIDVLALTFFVKASLREKCPNTSCFWSVFSRIRTEYGDILRNKSVFGHFRRSAQKGELLEAAVAIIKWCSENM